MFEYFNVGAFIVTILVSLPLLSKDGRPFLVLSAIMILLLFYSAYDSNSDVNNNIKSFQESKTLTCSSGGGLYAKSNKYSVSKKEGWTLQKNYFKKESLLIRADQCKLLDIEE